MRLVRVVAADLGVEPALLLYALGWAAIVTPFVFGLVIGFAVAGGAE